MSVIIEDYLTDKIIVHGRGTFAIKKALKELGAVWRPLKQGPPAKAWILDRSLKSKVKKLAKGKTKKKTKKVKKVKKVKKTSKTYGIDAVEKCIAQTALTVGISDTKVRAVIYEYYPQYHPKFSVLPYEIIEKIILEMDPYMITKFCITSKRMREVCESESFLWKKLFDKYIWPSRKEGYVKRIKAGERTYKQMFLIVLYSKDLPFDDYNDVKIDGLKMFQCTSSIDLTSQFKYNSGRKELVVPAGVWSVTCRNAGLKSIILPQKLQRLRCENNEITHLEIPDSLENLSCKNNNITGVLDLKNVRYAYLDNNPITNIKFVDSHFVKDDSYTRRYRGGKSFRKTRKKVGLLYISAYGCNFKRLDLRTSLLYSIAIYNSGVEEILLPTGTKLTNVDVSFNKLRILVLPKAVKALSCINNPLERVYISGAASVLARVKKELAKCVSSEGIIYYKGAVPDAAEKYSERRLLDIAPMGIDSLQKMPPEIIVEIMKKLKFFDVKRLCKTSSYLLSICKNDMLWKMLLRRDFNIHKDPEYYGYETAYALYHELAKDPKKWKRIKLGSSVINYVGLGRNPRNAKYPSSKWWKFNSEVSGSLDSMVIPDGVVAIRSYYFPDIRCKGSSKHESLTPQKLHCFNDLRVILQDGNRSMKFASLNNLIERTQFLKVAKGVIFNCNFSEEEFKNLPKKYKINLVDYSSKHEWNWNFWGAMYNDDKIYIYRFVKSDDISLYIPPSFFGIRDIIIPE